MATKDEILTSAFPLFVGDPEMRDLLAGKHPDLLQRWRECKAHHYWGFQEDPTCRKGLDILTKRMQFRGEFQKSHSDLKKAYLELLSRN